MDFVLESLRADWQALLGFSPRLVYALVLLSVLLLTGNLAGRAILKVMQGSERFGANARFMARLATWAIRLAAVLLALGILGFKGVAASLLATGGVMAIVLGFAFREVGENLLAGIFLAFSRPFELGDLIKSGGLTGTVRGIDIRSVHIRTEDACDVFVPSAQIFRQELYNYTRDGLRRPSFKVGVAYHDEPERVIDLLTGAARRSADVLADPQPRVGINEFSAGFIVYEVYFWLDTTHAERSILDVSNDVKTACWRALKEAGITFSTDVASALEIKSAPELTVRQS